MFKTHLKVINMKNSFKIFLSLVVFFSVSYTFSSDIISVVQPKNNTTFENPAIQLSWNKSILASSYSLQLSTDSLFSTLLVNSTQVQNFINYIVPATNTIYYWRVKCNLDVSWGSFYRFTIFKPSDFSGIKFHNKSDQGVTTSGNLVTQWNDLSSNSNHVKQSDPSSQPTLKPGVALLNNYPIIRFAENASSPDYLFFTNQIPLSDFTAFTLNSYVSNANKPAQVLLGGFVSGFFMEYANNGYKQGILSAGASSFLAANGSDLNTKYSIYSFKNNSLRKNKFPPSALASNQFIANITLDNIGTRGDASGFNFEGDLAEVLIYDNRLDSTKTSRVENYLHTKYAPPVNLGPDTVYGNSFCDTLTISASNRYVSYLWSTGQTTPSIKTTANGTYSVKVKDVFGFESTDDIVILPYKRLGNKTVYLCKGDTLKLDLNLPAGFAASWSNGINSDKINLTQSDTYRVTITDGRNCIFKDTINLVVNETSFTPTIVNKTLRICEDEKLYFQSNIPIESILWSNGDITDFTSFSTLGIRNIFVKTVNGCIIKDTFNVIITGKAPAANFITSTVCQNVATSFTNISILPPGDVIASLNWNFSNGTTSTASNPSVIFSTVGITSASLKIKTDKGCTDSIYKTFNNNKKPTASFETRLSCSGNPTQFVDKSRIGNANITTYNWLFGNNPTAFFAQNPQYEFPDQGTYSVLLKVSDENGCTDTLTQNIFVNPSPVSNFSFDSACGRTPVNFKFLASVQSPFTLLENFNWSFGDGNGIRGRYDPNNIYASPGVYSVSLAVQASNQCVDTATKQIRVFDFPIVDFTVSPTQCVNKEIQFTDISSTPDGTPINDWKWYFSGQSTSTEQNPRYAFNAQGNYTIQLTAKNLVGCVGTKLRSIAVSQAPVPQFTFTPQNGLPPLCVTYNNQSATNGNYIWNYGDNSPSISGYNPPQHCYNSVGNYPITLVSTDFRGCTDTARKFILVDRVILDGAMVSLIITPNGDFYKVQANIVNNSNVEITALGLNLQLGGGSVIRENWTGSLLPGQATTYQFNGEIKLSESNQIPVICASIDNVNNFSPENRTDNNSTCKEVKVGQFDVLNLYPNPAYETLNFGVMLPEDGKVTIGFITTLGQLEYQLTFNGLKGYNTFSSSTIPLNAAVYVAEIMYDGQVIRKKFMRKDRK